MQPHVAPERRLRLDLFAAFRALELGLLVPLHVGLHVALVEGLEPADLAFQLLLLRLLHQRGRGVLGVDENNVMVEVCLVHCLHVAVRALQLGRG